MMRRRKHEDREWALVDKLASDGWRTPDTWDGWYFSPIPDSPGIYLLMVSHLNALRQPRRVAYVGKSINLFRRLSGHTVIREIRRQDQDLYIQKWFLSLPVDEIGQAEIEAIRQFDPPMNLQFRNKKIGTLTEAVSAGAQA